MRDSCDGVDAGVNPFDCVFFRYITYLRTTLLSNVEPINVVL